jgi:hypothetical protein
MELGLCHRKNGLSSLTARRMKSIESAFTSSANAASDQPLARDLGHNRFDSENDPCLWLRSGWASI